MGFSDILISITETNKSMIEKIEDIVMQFKSIPRFEVKKYEEAIILINNWYEKVDPEKTHYNVSIRVLYCNVYVCYLNGDYKNIFKYHHEANQLELPIEDIEYLGLINRLVAHASFISGLLDFAIENSFSALKIFQSTGNDYEIVRSYISLGICYSMIPDHELQFKYFNEAYKIADKLGNQHIKKTILNNIAYTAILMEKFDEGKKYITMALELLEPNEESLPKVGIFVNLTRLHLAEGMYDEALIEMERVFDMPTLYSDKSILMDSFILMYQIQMAISDFDKAYDYLNDGLNVAIELDSGKYIAMIHGELSEFYLKKGDYQKAYEHQKQKAVYRERIEMEKASLQYLILRIEHELDSANRELLELKFQTNILTKELQSTKNELKETQEVTIYALATLAEYRDKVTGNHILRTTHYSKLYCELLRANSMYHDLLTDDFISDFSRSSSLHDIGKVGISDLILNKPGKLTVEEFEIMKRHTEIGRSALAITEKILGEGSFLRIAKEIAYTHHEKWDGSGYPEGLAGTDIPITGRIMAVIDVYDALISRRPYKKPMSHKAAVKIISELSGSQFDPELVNLFIAHNIEFFKIAKELFDSNEELESLIRGM